MKPLCLDCQPSGSDSEGAERFREAIYVVARGNVIKANTLARRYIAEGIPFTTKYWVRP